MRWLGWVTVAALGAGLYLGLAWAPPDAFQGVVQRIMYVHVPSAWVAFLAFAVVAAASGLYLGTRQARYDRVAHASAEVGVVFTALAILGGMLWGKPVWGTWWQWEPRLTTTAILLAIYGGYLLLRALVEDRDRAARSAAVVGIVGFLDVPLNYFSVVWWRTLHQPPSVLRPGGASMDPSMLIALLVNAAAFTLLYLVLVRWRAELARLEAPAWAAPVEGPAAEAGS